MLACDPLDFRPIGDALPSINLSKTYLQRSDFSGIDLRKSNFKQAKLKGSIFHNALLSSSDFIQAELIGANFEGASLSDTDFSRAQLCGTSFKDVEGLEKSLFTGAIIDSSTGLSQKQRELLLARGALANPCVSRPD
ncbi:MAG: pentapeptide repeat-containing protein [Cyanobacteriota bacterium]